MDMQGIEGHNSGGKTKPKKELDELQQQLYYLSRLQKIEIMLDQLKVRIVEAIHTSRKKSAKPILYNLVNNLDKCVEEYNQYYIDYRMDKLLFFKIDPLAISKNEPIFAQKFYLRDSQKNDENILLKFVYLQDMADFNYHMHIQIWKVQCGFQTTNEVMTRLQRSLMRELVSHLMMKGFVSHFDFDCIYLNMRKPNHMSSDKSSSDPNLNVIYCIQEYCIEYLKEAVNSIIKQQRCSYCNNYINYQSRLSLMLPPTYYVPGNLPNSQRAQHGTSRRQNNKQKNTILQGVEQKGKHFHQACALKYAKSNSHHIFAQKTQPADNTQRTH